MWIRSQQGDILVDAELIDIETMLESAVTHQVGYFVTCKKENTIIVLGEYSSKLEAHNVLDMIQRRIIMNSYKNQNNAIAVFKMPMAKEKNDNEE